MIYIDIKSDIKETIKDLEYLGAYSKFIALDILRLNMRHAQSEVKKSYKGYLKKRTGELYKSYQYKIFRTQGYAILFSRNQGLAEIHERGCIITPKSHKYLVFQINGKWIKTKESRIKASPFFIEGVKISESKLKDDINTTLEKCIERFEKRTTK